MERDAKLRQAEDIMSCPAVCVNEGDELLAAARMLSRRGWSGAPVVDEHGQLAGILSEHDLMQALARAAFHGEGAPATVGQVMTAPALAVDRGTDLFSLTTLLTDHKRVSVVQDGRPVGVISRKDLVQALVRLTREREGTPRRTTMEVLTELRHSHNPVE